MSCAGKLSIADLVSLAESAGCPDSASAAIAAAIAMGESSGCPTAQNYNPPREVSRGLWQVNILGNPQYASSDLYDPATNAAIMVSMSGGCRNWGPWGAYTDGSYLKYLAQAQAAAGASTIASSGGRPGSDVTLISCPSDQMQDPNDPTSCIPIGGDSSSSLFISPASSDLLSSIGSLPSLGVIAAVLLGVLALKSL